MPWSETSPMDQRTQFIADYVRDTLTVTELCQLYGVSRKTAYKWIDRYLRHGPAGLKERSRRPHCSPNETAPEIVATFLDARRRHPSWGAKKLLALVHKRDPRWDLQGRSTVCGILSRNGMVPKKRQRRRIGHPGKLTSSIQAPNDGCSAGFKGQFKTGDGVMVVRVRLGLVRKLHIAASRRLYFPSWLLTSKICALSGVPGFQSRSFPVGRAPAPALIRTCSESVNHRSCRSTLSDPVTIHIR